MDNESFSYQSSIWNESRLFDDILQFGIAESYFNNTLKVLALYEWLWLKCNEAKYLLKLDDDVFLNFPLFANQILSHEIHQSTLYGYVASGGKVPDKVRSKQYMPPDIYPYKIYNFSYVFGFAVLSSLHVVEDIHAIGCCLRGIYVDDVYLEGYLVHILGYKEEFLENLNIDIIFRKGKLKPIRWAYISKYLITPQLEPNEILSIYAEMTNKSSNLH